MLGRKRTPPEEPGRRRPLSASQPRQRTYSYYSRRSAPGEQSQGIASRVPVPRSKKEILQFAGQRFGMIVALIATVALLIVSVQVSADPRIKVVNNTDVYRIHPDSLYREALSRELRSSWSNSNKITINTERAASQLQQDYPELLNVSVALPVVGQRPIAYLQLTRPSLVLVNDSGAAFVLDENGRVLAPAAQVDNLDRFKLPTVSDQSGLSGSVGQLVLPGATVQFVRQVTYQLRAAQAHYTKLVLPQESQELDVYIQGRQYYARFNAHDDSARQQAGTYLAVQANLMKQGITPAAYIDVRLPGRAYYK